MDDAKPLGALAAQIQSQVSVSTNTRSASEPLSTPAGRSAGRPSTSILENIIPPTHNQVAELAIGLFKSWLYGEGEDDPDFWLAQVEEILAAYPLEVIAPIASGLHGMPGLPGMRKRPPVCDIKEWCDTRFEPYRLYRERNRERQKFLDSRALPPPSADEPPLTDERRAEIVEKYWGEKQRTALLSPEPLPERPKPPTLEELQKFYAENPAVLSEQALKFYYCQTKDQEEAEPKARAVSGDPSG